MTDGIARFRDFSEDVEPIQFKVGNEIFTALPTIPLGKLSELSRSGMGDTENQGDMAKRIEKLFGSILEEDSYQRFIAGLNSRVNPIGITHITKILPWLLEQYGLRPTEASSGSVASLSENGANSTDGLTAEAATSSQ